MVRMVGRESKEMWYKVNLRKELDWLSFFKLCLVLLFIF